MNKKMKPEEFVEWATGGVNYMPEPSVHHVLYSANDVQTVEY